MFRSFVVALFFVLLSFPCSAEISEEVFSRLDVNGDGVISSEEFMQGMKKSEKSVPSPVSAAERQKIIDETVNTTKDLLPMNIDQATTWTDIYGKTDEIHYIYRVNMDTSLIPSVQMGEIRSVFEMMVCQKMKPAICGVAKNTLMVNGISLTAHYNDNNGTLLGMCRFVYSDCP